MSILKMRQAQMYRNEATDGSEGGSGGGVDVQAILNTPEAQKAFQAMLDKEVQGLKKKNSELIDKEKKLKEQMSQYDGVDVEKIKALQKQIETNEEMRLLSEGKTEEVVTRRVEAMKRDFDANLAARDSKLSEYEKMLKDKEDRLASLVIDGQVREAYVGLDFDPEALDYALSQARSTFIMNEEGKAIPRDDHGSLIFGKDGKTPISAREWLEGLAEKKKFLRKQSAGAGTLPNTRSSGKIDVSKMSSSQKIAEGLRQRGMAA